MGTTSETPGSPLTNAAKPTKANVCCSFLINLTMLIFFAIYAFKNPDQDDCYIVYSSSGTDVYSDLDDVEEENYDYINMTLRFKIIFIIGFIISVVNLAYATLGFLYFMYEAKSMLNLVSCLVCVSGISTLGQMIYASVVIFGDDADLCKESDLAS